jgi:hypothetical protein
MAKTKDILVLYVILCLVGTILEWAYGTLWNLCGQAPWIYPNSVLRYTSFEGLPLWGLEDSGGNYTATGFGSYMGVNSRLLYPVA